LPTVKPADTCKTQETYFISSAGSKLEIYSIGEITLVADGASIQYMSHTGLTWLGSDTALSQYCTRNQAHVHLACMILLVMIKNQYFESTHSDTCVL
jgi:hypothetical protein